MIHCYSSCWFNSFEDIAQLINQRKCQKTQDIVLELNQKYEYSVVTPSRQEEDELSIHIFQLNICIYEYIQLLFFGF